MRRNPQKLGPEASSVLGEVLSGILGPPPQAAKKKDRPGARHIWERGHSSTWKVTSSAGTITATLPYGPSANEYWRTRVCGRGKAAFVQTYVSSDALEYRKLIAGLFDDGMVGPTAEPVVISIRIFRPQRAGDLDNRVKPLLDALTGNAWKDDSQVVEAHLFLDNDRANPRVEITIQPHAAMSNEVLDL